MAAALGRLLPNLGGPGDGVRRFYTGVVQSVALYGLPIWAGDLVAGRCGSDVSLRRALRRMAIRVTRGYRTISGEAAGLLAGIPPLDLLAEERATVYSRRLVLRRRGRELTVGTITALKRQVRRSTREKWRQRLETASAGRRTVEAVLPSLEAWLDGGCRNLETAGIPSHIQNST